MEPIINYITSLIDKYIVHIPSDQQETFKKDFQILAATLAESAAKGAIEGVKNG